MSAASVTDDETAAAIREALRAATTGDLLRACAIGEEALHSGGDEVALNALLGMLRCRAGEFHDALRYLRPAHEARPADISIASNLIVALVESGHNPEALAVATPEMVRADPSLRIARYRGCIAQRLGDAHTAAEAFETVVASAPQDWESWNNLGSARLLTGDREGAVDAFERSVAQNPDTIPTRINLARALVRSGKLDEAEEQLREAAERFPNAPQPLLELHRVLVRRGRADHTAILQVLEQASERDPANKAVLLELARQQMILGQHDRAEATFRRVLATDAANAEAYLGLATLYELSRPDALAELAREAERRSLESPALNVVRAFAHRRARRYTEGLAELKDIPEDFDPARTAELLGQFHDRLGNYDAAFAAFARMNEAQAADPYEPLPRAAALRSSMRERLDRTDAEWVASWKAPPVPSERPAPVFLVGFPRSGTTLLDTMLMGHPDVAVMEERPVLEAVDSAIGGFDGISELDERQVRGAQECYFETATRYVASGEYRLLVDKRPMLLAQVPLIRRIFPDARFILALRHPADAVLSCYISNFHLTNSTSNFLRLDTTAEFYDVAFQSWEKARALFPVTVHTVVYERLIEDTEVELRAVASALELDWRDEMLDHRETAASRGVIPTASYAQVTEPIYRRSVGRWRHYRRHLEPILPVLRPWAEKFGYSLEADEPELTCS